jgi:hypothetical protein
MPLTTILCLGDDLIQSSIQARRKTYWIRRPTRISAHAPMKMASATTRSELVFLSIAAHAGSADPGPRKISVRRAPDMNGEVDRATFSALSETQVRCRRSAIPFSKAWPFTLTSG